MQKKKNHMLNPCALFLNAFLNLISLYGSGSDILSTRILQSLLGFVWDLPFFFYLCYGALFGNSEIIFISPGYSIIKWGKRASHKAYSVCVCWKMNWRFTQWPKGIQLRLFVNSAVGKWNTKRQNVADPYTFHHTPALYHHCGTV